MDIARLVDEIELAIGNAADVDLIERVASAILSQQVLARNAKPVAHPSYPQPSTVNIPRDVFGSLIVGISLLECSSQLQATVRTRAYDKIRRVGARFVDTAETLFQEYGLVTPPLQLSVSPVSLFGNCGSVSDYVALAAVLDQAAVDVGAAAINGYALTASGGLTVSDRHFVDSIPSALTTTSRLICSVCTSPFELSTNTEIIHRLSETVAHSIAHSDDGFASCLNRLTILVNGLRENPSLVNHFYPTGLNEITTYALPSIERAFSRMHREESADYRSDERFLFEAVAGIVQVGNQIERRLASKLTSAAGMPIVSASEMSATANAANGAFGPRAFHAAGPTVIPIPDHPSPEILTRLISDFDVQATSLSEPVSGVLAFAR